MGQKKVEAFITNDKNGYGQCWDGMRWLMWESGNGYSIPYRWPLHQIFDRLAYIVSPALVCLGILDSEAGLMLRDSWQALAGRETVRVQFMWECSPGHGRAKDAGQARGMAQVSNPQ